MRRGKPRFASTTRSASGVDPTRDARGTGSCKEAKIGRDQSNVSTMSERNSSMMAVTRCGNWMMTNRLNAKITWSGNSSKQRGAGQAAAEVAASVGDKRVKPAPNAAERRCGAAHSEGSGETCAQECCHTKCTMDKYNTKTVSKTNA